MKIYKTLLLIFAFHCFFAAAAFAQGAIYIKLVDTPIREALTMIKKETGYKFFFEKDLLDPKQSVSVDVTDGTIQDVLNQVLKGLPIEYIVQKKQVLLKKKVSLEDGAQEQKTTKIKLKPVAGHVTNAKGEALPGLTIWLKGTNIGAATDANGDFTMKAAEGYTLVFSFIGYKTQELPVTGETFYSVSMEENINSLNEVQVVSSGYQEIPKERATGSYETISPREIESVPTINMMERLEGRVAGVNFDVANNQITVRGTNSYSITKPLIVVDGFPMPQEDYSFNEGKRFQGGAELSYLNPDDIANITILKDAAASSIWGSRAANGVIVITTKKGQASAEPKVNFSTAITVSDKPYLEKLKQMNSAQYIDFEQEMFDLGYLQDNVNDWTAKNLSEAQEWMFRLQRGTATEAERDGALVEMATRDNKQQIKDYLLRNAMSQQYNLSISGGSPKSSYFISGNYNDDKAVMKANEGQSYNVTASNTMSLFDDVIKLTTGINYMGSTYTINNTVQEALSIVSISGLRPYDMIVDEKGNSIDNYLAFRPEVIQGFEDQGYLDWTYNYLDELNYSSVIQKSNAIRLNAEISSDITSWLNASVSGMYYKLSQEQNTTNELNSYETRSVFNVATSVDSSSGDLVYGIPIGAKVILGNMTNENYNLRGQLAFNKEFNGIHRLNMLASAEIRQEQRSFYSHTFYGYNEDTNTGQTVNPMEYYTTVYGWSTFIGSENNSYLKYKNRYLSYVGSGTYSLYNRYFLSGSIRFDDYNMLGASRRDRAIPLWSGGMRWKILDEPFFNAPGFLSKLDARVTYGKGGSTPTGGLGNNNAIINLSSDDYTDLPVAYLSFPANSNLKWETTKTWNFGLDYGFLKDRVRGSLEYYWKKSDDILAPMPFNGTYGFTHLRYNAGTLEGHGVDFDISALILNKDVKWTSSFNLSYNTNEVTHANYELKTLNDYFRSEPMKGNALTSLYAYRWAGLDSNGQSLIHGNKEEVIGSDVNSTELEPSILKYMGTTTAPYFGGFFNTVSWKGFELSAQITYYMGHVFRKPFLSNYPTWAGTFYGKPGKDIDIASRWREAGDEANTNVPGLASVNYYSISRYNYADINVLPADHIRLQQVSLAYQVPIEWLKKSVVKSLSLSFYARNLGILWRKNKEGYDPQYLSTTNYSTLTPARNYTIRLSANF
ncbi:SusC/RagA family TonB-linked outer membrane protein [Sunxiuqinia indica]|uniref:SusC/RagA family TonB-linked outer membrane protein n=1 Tax=Sunxiuqinia indica TaxID=2692584 RepID=UPI001357F31D|nr:SusC/RagA family TonB-linked outer membrane protein [Sunxiuqinia indica]